jgi:DNA-binding transcriptional LysR family regulator
LKQLFSTLEFKLLRGNSKQIGEYLKRGDAELGIAVEIDKEWDRLDSWPLFTEGFQLVVSERHALASQGNVEFDDIKTQQLLSRGYCEYAERLSAALRACDVKVDTSHDISSEHDLIKLLQADIGIAIVPCSTSVPETLRRAAIEGLDIKRTVQLFGVAGRERTAVAAAVMKMLRSADWLPFTAPAAMPAPDAKPALAIVAA